MKNIDDCDVHACPTSLTTLRVSNAPRTGMKDSPRYVMARRGRFPNSDDVLRARGVWRERESVEVAVSLQWCAERAAFIRAEYPRWLESHELAG